MKPTSRINLRAVMAAVLAGSALIIALGILFFVRPDRQAVPSSAQASAPSARTLPSKALNLPPAPVAHTKPAVPAGPALEGVDPAEQASLWQALSAARHSIEPIDDAASVLPINQGARLFAQNPGQQFTTRFLDEGIRLASGQRGQDWQVEARATGLPAPTEIAYDGSRVEYTRGHVIEWYDNRPDGLQQGFIVKKPSSTDGNLRVDVALSGVAARTAGEDIIHLTDESGAELLSYAGLIAWDARGQQLPARMEATPEGLALLVSAQGAQYPVVIDPVFSSLQQKIEDNVFGDGRANDRFGSSVAISGLTAVVGAPGDDVPAANEAGSAYVFVRTGSIWIRQTKLTANDAASNDAFGTSVSIEGNTVVVGAPDDDNAGGSNAGSAYIFNRTLGTTAWGTNVWALTQKLLASDAAPNDAFGTSVAISGNTAAVGSPDDDHAGGSDAGSVYVFFRAAGIPNPWSQQAKLTANDGAADDNFGLSVAVSINTVVVGSPEDDLPAGNDAGSAYAFFRIGSVWAQQAKLTASDAAGGDEFGTSVAISGETALIGAPEEDNANGADAGSAYAFLRTKGLWSQQAKLTANDGAIDDAVGTSVAISGNIALLGAPGFESNVNTDKGKVYQFFRVNGAWSLREGFDYAVRAGAEFGSAVAMSGLTAIVGAPSDNATAGSDSGTASIVTFSKTGFISGGARLDAGEAEVGREAGTSVAVSGNSIIVGAPIDDSESATDVGRAFALTRIGTAWFLEKVLAHPSGAGFDYFGSSVAISGSLAVIGAPGDDTSAGTDAGSAHTFLRNAKTREWTSAGELVRTDSAANGAFGTSVAVAGSTFLVGAPYDTTPAGSKAGSVYSFTRAKDGSFVRVRLTASDAAANDFFGYSVALGKTTALIGAPGDDTAGGMDAGSAYAFLRTKTGWTQQLRFVASDGAASDAFGTAVSIFGNNALIGAPTDDNAGGSDAGGAYVFVRGKTGWAQEAKLTDPFGSAGDRFGTAVAVLSDTALVGAPLDDVISRVDAGSVSQFTKDKGTTNWSRRQSLNGAGFEAGDKFGACISLTPTIAVIGSPWDDTDSGVNTGNVNVFVP